MLDSPRNGFTALEAALALLALAILIAIGISSFDNAIDHQRELDYLEIADRLDGRGLMGFRVLLHSMDARDYRGPDGATYLHSAGIKAYYDAAVWLLDEGYDINARTRDGRTPLIYALDRVAHEVAHDDHVRYLGLLISRGAEVNAIGRGGTTALHSAAMKPEPSFTMLLLKAGADANAERADAPHTPLAVAAEQCRYAVVQSLIEAGADVNGGSHTGEPLYRAAAAGHHAIVIALLEADANPDGGMFSPIDGARAAGELGIVNLLLNHGTAGSGAEGLPKPADTP